MTPRGDLTTRLRRDDNVNTVWTLEHYIKNEDDIEKYLSIPDDLLPVDTAPLRAQAAELGDRGILLVDLADPLCIVADLFDFGEYTVLAYSEPETMHRLLGKVFDRQKFFLEDMLKKGAGPLFRLIGPEYATSPYLSPEFFQEYVCRYDSQLIRMIHDYGQLVRIHCHGRLSGVLDHLLSMDPDALDPVEAPPSGDIELSEVKRRTAGRICLMGNIQLRDLEYATAEEMRRITKDCIDAGKPGGGFVLMPTASPINEPLSPVTERNYRIMIETALEFGAY